MRFENKVAMVTGASVGIGRACAVRLAKEGAKLVLFDINAEQLDKVKEEVAPYTTDVLTYTCDVSDEAAVNAAVADAMQHFGRIDVLINNAAIWRTWKTFMAVTTEEWKKFIDINVMGVVYCTRAVLGSMIEHHYGRIVNVGIIGEAQLAQRILRRVDFLRGCTFQQFSCFYRVQYQQSTVTVRRADDVLCVCIFCIC